MTPASQSTGGARHLAGAAAVAPAPAPGAPPTPPGQHELPPARPVDPQTGACDRDLASRSSEIGEPQAWRLSGGQDPSPSAIPRSPAPPGLGGLRLDTGREGAPIIELADGMGDESADEARLDEPVDEDPGEPVMTDAEYRAAMARHADLFSLLDDLVGEIGASLPGEHQGKVDEYLAHGELEMAYAWIADAVVTGQVTLADRQLASIQEAARLLEAEAPVPPAPGPSAPPQ